MDCRGRVPTLTQLTYDVETPTLEIDYEIHVHVPADPEFLEDHLRWRTPEIGIECVPFVPVDMVWGDSDAWYGPDDPYGKGMEPTITYQSLPHCNDAFGRNEVILELFNPEYGTRGTGPDDPGTGYATLDKVTFEVFYPKEGTNHPGVHAALTGPDAEKAPNWFYYWNEELGDSHVSYNNLPPSVAGEAPAMSRWRIYAGPVGTIWVSDSAATEPLDRDRYPQDWTGIDWFKNILLHEQAHVTQILQYNPYINQHPGRYSLNSHSLWSFNVPYGDDLWNHYCPDHGNDSEEKKDLDVNRNDVPDIHPHNLLGEHAIERWADKQMTNAQDTYKEKDWGNPGKQHGSGAYND